MSAFLDENRLIFEMFSGGKGTIWIFFIVTLILLIKSKNKKVRDYYLYPAIIVLIFILNPICIKLLVDTEFLAPNRYVRLYWLLPVGGVIAYACVEAVKSAEKKKGRKYITLAHLIIGIMITGNYMFTAENYTAVTNIYKLPDGTIEVTDMICEDVEADGKSLSETKIAVPVTLSPYIRQYNGEIKMLYGRNIESNIASSEVYRLMQEEELNISGIQMYTRKDGCDYVVLEAEKTRSESMEEYGYEEVGEVEGYIVYKDMLTDGE